MTHGSAVSDLKWMALKGFRPELVQMALEKKLLALSCQRMRRERTRSKGAKSKVPFFREYHIQAAFEKRKSSFARFHRLPKAFKLTAAEKSVIITEEA